MDSLHCAKAIVQKLVRHGYIAYFAGGWVRDYLMGNLSEDIDIATSASPAEIMDLFPRTTLVGIHFGVVIVTIESHQFEVATFRKDLKYLDGRHPEGIELSTPIEDALRRDFTINGMFFDPMEDKVHDYVKGREDIQRRVIRTIGNPHERFHEDRLRMLRAFRFEARFGFAIDPDTQQAIFENADTLFPAVAMERVWQEFTKMSCYPRFDHALVEMHRLQILPVIFPEIEKVHLDEVKHRTSFFSQFPSNTPTILYLIQLFSDLPLNQKLDLVKRLKCTHKDVTWVEYYQAVLNCLQSDPEDLVQWAHLLADERSEVCFAIAVTIDKNRDSLKGKISEVTQRLRLHIERIQKKRPLISSEILRKQGIQGGPYMGQLLREAERLAIVNDIHDLNTLFSILKQSPLWREHHA